MISIEHVHKNYGSFTAVKDLSIQVAEGETLILLGPSGCGKTTTLKMINRLIEADSGSIKIRGEDIRTQKPEVLRRNIGYVIQSTGLFPHYTVEENIAVVPNLLKWGRKKTLESTLEILHKVRLPEMYLKKYPAELSGGQQQRVGLARALITDPSIVLMDEPLGALDPVTRNDIRREFRTLEAIRGKTVIMVTHDIEEAFELGDKICVMNKGTIQQSGTPISLLFQPKNDFVKQFFNSQRYRLEMKTLTVRDLNLSPFYVSSTAEPNLVFHTSTSLDAVFNSLKPEKDKQLIAIENQDNEAASPPLQILASHREIYNVYLETLASKTYE